MSRLEDLSWKELVDRLVELEPKAGARASEAARLVQDLHVHQVELEMQNRELREAQAELEASRARYADLYDKAPVGYATLDGAGRVLEINLTACSILARPRDALVGSPFTSLDLLDRAAFHAHLQQAAACGAATTTDLALRTSRGERILQMTTTATPSEEGATVFQTVLLDATELRSTQARARQLDAERRGREAADAANRMKDQFLSIVSHELRTPLTAVLGWTQLLEKRPRDAELVTRGVEVMRRNSEILARMVDDLLDVSRIISGKLRLEKATIDLGDVVHLAVEIARPGAENRRVALSESIAARCFVAGDAMRLQQVVSNLLSNALKFTPAGGHVWISLRCGKGRVVLAVRDNGAGVEPAELPHVFEAFHQADRTTRRSSGGLGLGLAIARSLVEGHEGAIRVRSEGAGRGATFEVDLPLVEQAPLAPPGRPGVAGASAAHGSSLAGIKVLYVDDERDTVDLVKMMLDDCGAVVRTAGSVNEALDVLAGFVPDVLVSDIAMPGRDGYDLIREVRGMPAPLSALPAIALTAHARANDAEEALDAGFARHLAKPIDAETLTGAIAEVV